MAMRQTKPIWSGWSFRAGKNQGPMCVERNARQNLSPLDGCPVEGATASDAGSQQAKEIAHGVFIVNLARDASNALGVGFEWEDKERRDIMLLEFYWGVMKGKFGFKGTIKASRPGKLGTLWRNEEGQLKYEREVSNESEKAILSVFSGTEVSVTPKEGGGFEVWASLGFKIGTTKLLAKPGIDREGAVLRFESTTVQETRIVEKIKVEIEGTYYVELRPGTPEVPKPTPVPVKAPIPVTKKLMLDEVKGILRKVKGLNWAEVGKDAGVISLITAAVVLMARVAAPIAKFGGLMLMEAEGVFVGVMIPTEAQQEYLDPLAKQGQGI